MRISNHNSSAPSTTHRSTSASNTVHRMNGFNHRRRVRDTCRGPCCSSSSSSRCVVARMYNVYNDELADRTKEVWDDEEDIQAAVQRLGLKDKDQKAGGASPLLTRINKLYLDKDFPEAYIGQLEIRFIEGKGYGLVATQQIQKGQVLAVCPPLAWLSGAPGKLPRLEALIRHFSNMQFSTVQVDALHSLCSLPAIDGAHYEQYEKQKQQTSKDRLLAAASKVEAAAGQGTTVSSVPLSKVAAIKRMQQQLQQERELDLEGVAEDGTRNDRSKSVHNRWRRGSSGLESSIVHAAAEQRKVPDMLQLLQCTAHEKATAAAAAATGPSGASASGSSSTSSPAGGSSSSLKQLGMSAARLTALVCCNALAEMSQDLPVCSTRGDRPASLTGIWPLLALFNHSCAANAVAVLTGGVPTSTAQQQKLLQQGQPAPAAAAAAANGKRAIGRSSSGAVSPGPVNRWAKVSSSRTAQQKPPAGTPAECATTSTSTSSSNAPLSVPGSSTLDLSSEPGVGPFVLVRAVTDMQPGDEITLDYLAPSVEGSLIHADKRRAALAQRWGFSCRCERCTAEEQLGQAVSRTQHSANALAAKLGPQVAAALAAGDKDALQAAAASLRSVLLQLEQQVNSPTIPPRVAAWAHASVYQVHALLAACRMGLAPTTLPSLATVGTAMEVAGAAASGSSSHVLGAASLLLASQDAWGEEDERTHAAAHGLLEVLQLRYGPLDPTVGQQLVASAQRWAYELTRTRLGLVAPAAAAAVRARLALTAAANKQQNEAAAAVEGATASGAAAADTHGDRSTAAVPNTQVVQSSAGNAAQAAVQQAVQSAEEVDSLANVLELQAEQVLEVTDEILQDIYDDPEAQVQQPPPVDVFVKQRSEQDVLEQLQVFAGYAQALSPEQRWQQLQQQMLAQQQQDAGQPGAQVAAAAAADDDDDDAVNDKIVLGSEDISAVDLPMAAWLQEGPMRDTEGEVNAQTQQEQEQQKQRLWERPAQTPGQRSNVAQQQQASVADSAAAHGRVRSSSSRAGLSVSKGPASRV